MSGIKMSEIGEILDLPELSDLTRDEIAENFAPACIAGLSDGDLVTFHERYTDPAKIKLYGETVFNAGEVAIRLQEAAIDSADTEGPIRSLQGFMAELYCNPASIYANTKLASSLQIFPEVIVVDDVPTAIVRPPRLVLDYTPCLSSKSFVSDQLAFAEAGAQMFTYTPTARTHFMNRALMLSYNDISPGLTDLFTDRRFYIGREDGIASATDEIIKGQNAAGAPANVADLIICNGNQHTTMHDLEKGIANAGVLLSDEGSLVIRAFAKPGTDEIGADEIAEWAIEAGLSEKSKLEYEGHVHTNIGATVLSAKPPRRTVKTIILGRD